MQNEEESHEDREKLENKPTTTTTTTTESGIQRTHFKSKKSDSYVNKQANVDQLDLDSLTHDELLAEAKRLQAHLIQLKNIANKSATIAECANANNNNRNEKIDPKKPVRTERAFNFGRFNKRHVFIRFAYLGWNYQGYTVQEGTNKTVEYELFEALKRTKLIESRETSNYHRCGRTDKGVSAFSQVISIDVRSNCASGEGVIVNAESGVKNEDINNEINYVKLLNGVLPDDIRAIAWSPVSADMSARFDCVERVYRYFLPRGDLDVEAMRDAGKRLVGEKDFRNFCKMDVANGVVTFLRRIDNVSVNCLDNNNNDSNNSYSMLELIIEGSSFLWHQIRCVVAILVLIGQRKEPPSLIDDLLDIDKYPSKPQYTMVHELPLCLFECEFEASRVAWRYDPVELSKCVRHLQETWLENETRACIVKRMIDSLEDKIKQQSAETTSLGRSWRLDQPYSSLQGKSQPHAYVPFAERQRAGSLEERVDHYVKKRRLNPDVYEKINETDELAKKLNIYKPNNSS